jgi:DNA polymerase elongation subunit (family B)
VYQNLFIDNDVVHLWDDKKGYYILPISEYRYAYRKAPNGQHITFTGVACNKTSKYYRHEPDVFESDVPLDTRILTDIYLDSDEPSVGHRVVFFDIETSTDGGFPNVETADRDITAITLYDATIKEYHVYVVDNSHSRENYSQENIHVNFFVDEFDLLYHFVDLWEGISPTIASGWNSDFFDVPYLYRRLQHVVGMNNANRLSCIGRVKFAPYNQRYQIAGLSSIDYLLLYKKFTYSELPNYRLGTVGEVELGLPKIEFDGTLDELFEEDLDTFIKYSIRDVEILVGLEEKMKLIELSRGICHIGHVPYEDYGMSSRWLEGTIITDLHRRGLIATDKNPAGKEMMDTTDKFEGAYVKTPLPAKHDWVFSMDLQSLYPSIIMSLNISPETKVASVVNQWDVDAFTSGEGGTALLQIDNKQKKLTYDQLRDVIKDGNMCISSNGVLYRQDKRGVIPSILEKWFANRLEFQSLMKKALVDGDAEAADYYDRRQHIQKIFLNSLYGVLGLPIFRFFDIDNASAVTTTGQTVIKQSEQIVNEFYEAAGAPLRTKTDVQRHNDVLATEAKKKKKPQTMFAHQADWCIYIDTDSLYISAAPLQHKCDEAGLSELDFTIKLATLLETKLNTYYDDMALDLFNCTNHRFHIKGENVAKTAIWIAKKRYAMLRVYDLEKKTAIDNKMKATGLDIVRSQFPIVFKTYMEEFIYDILDGMSKKEVDDKMMNFYNELKNSEYRMVARNSAANGIRKYTIDDAPFGKYAKSAPMHIKACINYNKLLNHYGLDTTYPPIGDGEKIKYVMLKNNPFRIEHSAFKDDGDPPQIKEFLALYCDNSKMFDVELKKKLEGFYNALSWGVLPTDAVVDADLLKLFGE